MLHGSDLKRPVAPRSTSLASLISSSPLPKSQTKGFFAGIGTRLYEHAVKSSPPIWSDSESDEEECLESPTTASIESLEFDDESLKGLMKMLENANEKLALNPKTILAENGSIHLQSSTLDLLTKSLAPPSGVISDPVLHEFWTQFLEQDGLSQLKKIPHLLIARVRSAPIPQDLRARVWVKLCCVEEHLMGERYKNLLLQYSNCEKLIEKDIGRTFPKSEMFKDSKGNGQQMLFRILKVFYT